MPDKAAMTLPQEIFDDVIGHVAFDPTTLQTAAIVSSAWLATARSYLFSSVALDPPKSKLARPTTAAIANLFLRATTVQITSPSPCARLYAIIDAVEKSQSRLGSVAKYIRHLRLCEGIGARQWFASEPTLPLLLRSLNNLLRFEITRSASLPNAWAGLPSDLRRAIGEHSLRLPDLRELRLSSLVFQSVKEVEEILKGCKGLRVLEVDHFDFKDVSAEDNRGETIGEKIPLDVLVIGPRTSVALLRFLSESTSPVAVNTVRRLSLSISGNFADFAKLLHSSVSVEKLELTLMNDVDLQQYSQILPSQQFDLSEVPQLQSFHVNIDVLQKMDDPLPWISTLLRSGVNLSYPTRPNAMRNIWIVYSLYLPAPYMDRSVNTTIFDGWSDIDAVLCGRDPAAEDGSHWREVKSTSHAYSDLERVGLEFMLENPIGFGVAPRFLKEVVLDSPGLERRKVLTINAFDTSK